MLCLSQKEIISKQIYRQKAKKLVLVLATSALMIEASKKLVFKASKASEVQQVLCSTTLPNLLSFLSSRSLSLIAKLI